MGGNWLREEVVISTQGRFTWLTQGLHKQGSCPAGIWPRALWWLSFFLPPTVAPRMQPGSFISSTLESGRTFKPMEPTICPKFHREDSVQFSAIQVPVQFNIHMSLFSWTIWNWCYSTILNLRNSNFIWVNLSMHPVPIMCHNYWALLLQLLKPTVPVPMFRNKRSHDNEKPVHWD